MDLWNLIPPLPTKEQAAEAMGILAMPAKRLAALAGYMPEGYRYQTPAEAKQWMEDAALGFAGSVTPKVGIRAYHGSPHDFDKFSMSKIGSGEGAQAYGHGLYFAEKEGVARSYRDVLAGTRGAKAGDADISAWASKEPNKAMWLGEELQKAGAAVGQAMDSPAAMNLIINRVAGLKSQTMHPAHDRAMAALDQIEAALSPQAKDFIRQNFAAPPGRMYEVNIRANPNEFLDWDKPLSQQAHVLDALRSSRSTKIRDIASSEDIMAPSRSLYGRDLGPVTGEDVYKRIAIATSPGSVVGNLKTGAALNNAGIPGIRYLDQGSRGTGTGTSNYVLFRDDIIDILRKFGIPGVGVAGAGALAPHMLPPQQQY